MLFNSLEFLVFFPTVTAVFFLLPQRFRWLWLLLSSCIFYMAFVPAYILILLGTIVVDYFAGILIENNQGQLRKIFLIMSILANVGVLCVFKYYNFFIESVESLSSLFHTQINLPLLSMLLPIGLSFHTFQAMSYTIEVYRGNQKAERHFGIYALYVMFFPQLVAGPIERPQNMLHQFYEKHSFNGQRALDGVRQMLLGFFKKVVIADRLALYVNPVINNYHQYHFMNIVIACIFFSFQIYCDFSGYSDIALGAARILGFNLMTNFDRPFSSKNITEFWRRWHVSLSSWLRDYLYNPIATAKRNWGKAGIVFALTITLFISGLWHGAGWGFIVYGFLNGLALCFEFLTTRFRRRMSKRIPAFIYLNASLLLTFFYATFTWIFFRARSISGAMGIIRKIVTLDNTHHFLWVVGSADLRFNRFSLLAILVSLLFLFVVEKYSTADLKSFNSFPKTDVALGVIVLTLILVLGIFNQTSFIYFQF